jgi:hypothetical protein
MNKTIGIIAPLIDTRQYNMDFTLRLAANNRELTLATFYELTNAGYIAENVSRGRDYGEDIPNLCIPGEHGFSFTKREEEQVNYDEDYTRWDLINEMPFKVPLRTSIGCPFRCRFCDFCQLFPNIYLRSKDSLSRELDLVKSRLGQNLAVIHVSDDNVFINKKRLFDVCNAIADSGLNHWIGFMRGGEYSDDEMDAIVRSGLMEKWSHFTMNSDDAVKACYDLFREVINVPYSYSEESYFFNRGMFSFDTRRSLYQLRQQLTIKLIEKEPWEQIWPIVKKEWPTLRRCRRRSLGRA